VAVDNFCTGRRANVAHLRDHPEFTLVQHDITIPWHESIGVSEQFDAVLDLASPASPLDFATMPLEILAVGSVGTRGLLDPSRRDARFFLASTREVYGDPLVHPQPETHLGNVSCIGPRNCYDEAKRFSEALTMPTTAPTASTSGSCGSSRPMASGSPPGCQVSLLCHAAWRTVPLSGSR
jgi:dTDP-glucose 4,6-dehydratase